MEHERDRSIDMFKVLLVIGMILCHCIMLLKIYGIKSYLISEYFNVITFPGFLFCFGYAVGIAYLPEDKKTVSKKLIKNCYRTLGAFYLSGLGFELLVNQDHSLHTLLNVLILNTMPGYSEFLAGFFVLNLMTLIFFNQFKVILTSKWLILLIILSLLATKLPYNKVPTIQLGLLLGSTKFASFPVLQYLGYYLIGAYFQQHIIKFNGKFLVVSILCSAVFLQYVFTHHVPPLRFPPSLRWVIGGAGVLYGYYYFSIWASGRLNKDNPLYLIGEKPLQFLVLSNLFIFALRRILVAPVNSLICVVLFIFVLTGCYILVLLMKRIKEQRLV